MQGDILSCGSKPMVPFYFGVGALPILGYFSGDWDVHWGLTWVLTHGQMFLSCLMTLLLQVPDLRRRRTRKCATAAPGPRIRPPGVQNARKRQVQRGSLANAGCRTGRRRTGYFPETLPVLRSERQQLASRRGHPPHCRTLGTALAGWFCFCCASPALPSFFSVTRLNYRNTISFFV